MNFPLRLKNTAAFFLLLNMTLFAEDSIVTKSYRQQVANTASELSDPSRQLQTYFPDPILGDNLRYTPMRQEIEAAVADAIRAAEYLKEPQSLAFIEMASVYIANCFEAGGKVLIAGNGGSLCDAMHFAEELTGVFRGKRKALPAIALSDPGHMSCVANDLGFDEVFSRGVEAYGRPGDILILLTTSGNSGNLIKAAQRAKAMGMQTIALLGKTGGKLLGQCDLEWVVPGFGYSDRIQEAHMAAIHILIEIVEKRLFATPCPQYQTAGSE